VPDSRMKTTEICITSDTSQGVIGLTPCTCNAYAVRHPYHV